MRGLPAIAGLLLAGAAMAASAGAQDEPLPQQRVWTSSRVDGNAEARQEEPDVRKVIENQEIILERLDEIMEELKIIKVRATLR